MAAALADAFAADPVYTWMLPRRRQAVRLRRMFAVEIETYILRQNGTVWTTPGIDGAVCELPPGAWEMPKAVQVSEAFRWVRACGLRMPVAAEVAKAMEQRHLQEPHFYIRTVGVRSALQGQGLGSRLMGPTLERADAAGVATYLEASSERSAVLYARLGFVHLGVLELPRGGPPLWPMRRPPASETAMP